jgi:hypothetical protein
VIAKTLLLEAFHALDQTPHSPHMRKLLRRVEGGVYARVTAIPDDPYRDAGPMPDRYKRDWRTSVRFAPSLRSGLPDAPYASKFGP